MIAAMPGRYDAQPPHADRMDDLLQTERVTLQIVGDAESIARDEVIERRCCEIAVEQHRGLAVVQGERYRQICCNGAAITGICARRDENRAALLHRLQNLRP